MLKLQRQLIQKSKRSGKDLFEVLKDNDLTFDDLVYENSKTKKWIGKAGPSLSEFGTLRANVPVVSFFSGCGGLDLGFEAAGFHHVAAFEFNELFCKTLRRNRPNWKIFGPPTHSGDVSKFEDIAGSLSGILNGEFEGIFIGGPPCQPFSIAANQRFSRLGDNFKRVGFDHSKNGNLLFDYIKLILEFRPATFSIENVPGLRDIDGGKQLSVATELLKNGGYVVEAPLDIDAMEFGVPQQRKRLFVIGSRTKKSFVAPKVLKERYGSGSVLQSMKRSAENFETREHKVESVERYMKLDYGCRDQMGRVDRLDPELPSKTVIAGGTNGGGRSHLHPEVPRTLSVRECARLQTFPDDYIFVGPSARQFTQVGNAVPPVLAAQIAQSLAHSYF